MTRAKWVVLALVVLAALAGTGILAARGGGGVAAQAAGDSTAVAAAASQSGQPLPFPHKRHAGDLKIPCMYCHYTADRSVDAGIPPVATCAGCHLPGGAPLVAADSPGVKILTEYWNKKEPIPWVRIYKLPDYVHFPHMMHIKAGLECQTCHGPVEQMVQVRQFPSLRMGWCIQCHRERNARTDCSVCHY